MPRLTNALYSNGITPACSSESSLAGRVSRRRNPVARALPLSDYAALIRPTDTIRPSSGQALRSYRPVLHSVGHLPEEIFVAGTGLKNLRELLFVRGWCQTVEHIS